MFCAACGKPVVQGDTFCKACGAKVLLEKSRGKGTKILLSLLLAIGPFCGLIALWGFVNILIAGTEMSEAMTLFNNVIIPVLFALAFLCMPIGIVLAIFFALKGKGAA